MAGSVRCHLAILAEAELKFPPGSDSAYSSAGYSVLARVLEIAGGRPYAELLEAVVLAPAGAVQTVHPRGHDLTGAIDLLRDDLLGVAADEDLPPPTVPSFEATAVPAAVQVELEGIYQLRAGAPDSEEPLRFEGEIARLGDWVLIPVGTDRFFSPQDYAAVRAVRTEERRVEGLVWGEGEEAPTFPRVRPLP